MTEIFVQLNKSSCHSNEFGVFPLLPEGRWDRASYPRSNWFLFLIEQDDVVVVIARQPLAHLPVTDNESVVDFAEMSDFDNVTKLGNFIVFGEFNTVWLV